MRISHLSQVAVPSPHGVFRTGTRSLFVGSGIGPVILIPVLSAMVFSSPHTSSSFLKSVLVSRIRAFLTMVAVSPSWFRSYPLRDVLNTFCLIVEHLSSEI